MKELLQHFSQTQDRNSWHLTKCAEQTYVEDKGIVLCLEIRREQKSHVVLELSFKPVKFFKVADVWRKRKLWMWWQKLWVAVFGLGDEGEEVWCLMLRDGEMGVSVWQCWRALSGYLELCRWFGWLGGLWVMNVSNCSPEFISLIHLLCCTNMLIDQAILWKWPRASGSYVHVY